ncbi:MAG: hypothetical protein ABIH28_03260 [archaeon]
MAIEVEKFGSFLTVLYEDFLQTLPSWAQTFLNLFLLALLVALYAILIWKFYRWIAKKDILELNLAQYNKYQHSGIAKALAVIIYLLEYLIILPIVIFVWFSLFTLFLMLLTENLEMNQLLIISVTIITAIRITSYYKEDLSRDLAKLLPLTLLGVAITQGLVNFEKVLTQVSAIPSFFNNIGTYLIFILVVEYLLRGMDIFFSVLGLSDNDGVNSEKD